MPSTAQEVAAAIERERLLQVRCVETTSRCAGVLREFQHHYDHHRSHRSLRQAAPSRPLPHDAPAEIPKIKRHDVLGGLLHEYQQAA